MLCCNYDVYDYNLNIRGQIFIFCQDHYAEETKTWYKNDGHYACAMT